ncbi:signal peptidase I [Candidatus Shapirobacteria bacterium CG09_land_8_20_14_0_10_47_13]|uniref:Signal peptidase I n=1 Tax=Candidatus Shapirobacteria bacterium CG09_land_8_20_14_0_10_47_13 TaxID=1974481 RepID=A0A2H0WMS1_9BACT|nr:MAG: signal peptidase I [Candidatus Shapirobacteria bacterium CG09_land_8_20_14_0_10_47_13]
MGILKRIISFFLDFVEVTVIALAMFVIMYLFLFQPHQVKGSSDFPNFHDSEYLLTDKISYRLTIPKRGEVIIFKAPRNEDYDYIKRIIGLPGETVMIRNGKVYLNNRLLTEPYIPADYQTFGGSFAQEGQLIPIPEGQYFVLGDNRSHSSDSRDWGTVPRENIIGKAWLRYWPLDRVGLIARPEYL